MTDDAKLELLLRAGDVELHDAGFSAGVLRRINTRPPSRRWIILAGFTLAGASIALLISPLPAAGSIDLSELLRSTPSSSLSLMICGLIALLALGASLTPE